MNRIAKYRRKLNWTQKKLGKKSGLSREKIAHLEGDYRKIKLKDAVKISRALNKSIEKVFL